METLMKIDAAQVRQLREARAWSQDHLARAAGLSLRTVQRVEAEGAAALETRLALAAALEVSVADLDSAPPVRRAGDGGWSYRPLGYKLGVICGSAGARVGLGVAWQGVWVAGLSGHDAGNAYGTLGALSGITFAFIGTLVGRALSLRR